MLDLAYSFFQHSQQAMQGDLMAVVLPQEHYAKVLEEPFGLAALLNGERYAGSNRYMIHEALYLYYNHVPQLLHAFFDPVESLYIATAFFKTMLQLGLCLLLAAYAFGAFALRDGRFWAIALCMAAFFQTLGFRSQMGIIDPSIVYTFFYALPLGLLLLFFYPWYRLVVFGKKDEKLMPGWLYPVWTLLALFLAFSGPLVPPLAVMFGGILLLYAFWQKQHRASWLLFLYTNQPVQPLYRHLQCRKCRRPFPPERCTPPAWPERNDAEQARLAAAFARAGAGRMAISQPGAAPPISRSGQSLCSLRVSCWFTCCCCRWRLPAYRPNIVRYDTFMPVTFFVLIALGSLAYRVILAKKRPAYFVVSGLLLVIFWNADRPKNARECEYTALKSMLQSGEVLFPENCSVLSWKPVTDGYEREGIVQILGRWGILEEK
ncbi:MAG: hypothetical protein R3B47_12620 [Bacteroidia bacterium]